jgi:flagellar hook-length control protein FliK
VRENSKALPEFIAPKIGIEQSTDAEPTERPRATDLNPTHVERPPESVRHAVAYTWAALEKETNSAAGQKKMSSVPLGTSVRPAQASSHGSTVSGNLRLLEGGVVQVLVNESKFPVQPQAKASAEPLTITSEALSEWEPTERALAEIAPRSESMDTTLLSGMKISAENPGARIDSPEGSKKTSDCRLTIKGNHSLMEIRSETVRKVAEHLDRLLVTRSKSESVILMQPEELGSITMVVRNIKNDIEAVVTASDERVRELLHESRQDLIHNLNQKGHSEVRVTVAAETNSAERQPSNRDSSNPQDQSQRSSTSSDFGSNANGQSFSREQEREGSHSNRVFRFEDERIIRTETTPSKKTETFRRFQKVIDVAI